MTHTPKTWWGDSFVNALEGFIDSGRLQRGKSYRTDKRVLFFDMQLQHINATVLGNANAYFGVTKPPKYKISIAFQTIDTKEWNGIIQRIAMNPSWLAKLMLKEVPSNIEDAFTSVPLLPVSYKEIKGHCTCPDHATPCKHIAGIYYRIANMLDSNPMLLFELRGLTMDALIEALEKTEFGQVFVAHLAHQPESRIDPKTHYYRPFQVSNHIKHPSNEHIWTLKPHAEENSDDEDHEQRMPAGLIKKQGDNPEFWTQRASFINVMEEVYQTIKRKNAKQLM